MVGQNVQILCHKTRQNSKQTLYSALVLRCIYNTRTRQSDVKELVEEVASRHMSSRHAWQTVPMMPFCMQ